MTYSKFVTRHQNSLSEMQQGLPRVPLLSCKLQSWVANCLSIVLSSATLQYNIECICVCQCCSASLYPVTRTLKLVCQCLFRHLDGWSNLWEFQKLLLFAPTQQCPFFFTYAYIFLCKLQELICTSTNVGSLLQILNVWFLY